MKPRNRSSRRQAYHLVCEPLETRELLNAASISAAEGRRLHTPAAILPLTTASTPTITSTVPANGDLNPYGVAVVPADFPRGGLLHPGDILVSNFNAKSNLQGTGTTIVDISPKGTQSLFFQGPQGLGLSTALGVLERGYVIVGNLPSVDGTPANAQPGSLLFLDRNGKPATIIDQHGNHVTSLAGPLINGPWDLTIKDQGNSAQVFVSNVLDGTITRINLKVPERGPIVVLSMTRIASGYAHTGDPNAFEIGPTGLAFDARTGILYVASTDDNAIYAVPNAARSTIDHGKGSLVYQDSAHLRGPLGLVLASNGDLITANGDAINPDPNQTSELVEFTPQGKFVAQFSIDPKPGGAFGLAVTSSRHQVSLAAVNDNQSTLEVFSARR